MHLLYRYPRLLGPGNYADVGVFRGASTVCMAQGLHDGGHRGTVYAVDLFEDPTPLDPHSSDNSDTPRLLQAYFAENYKSVGLEICIGDSGAVAQSLDVPFKFVFIDADHTYEGCKKDYLAWERLIVPGGMLAFHDANYDTVDRVIQEIDPHWELVRQIFTTKLFKRRAK